MMKKYAFLIFLMIALTAATTAQAEYGEWEKLHSLGGPPGLSNAVFLSLGIGDIDNLYTAGLQQVGGFDMDSGWKSVDGGSNWDPIIQTSVGGGNECSILELFSFTLANDAASPDRAAYAGFGVDDECIENTPAPECLFKCIFQMKPYILYTEDGGQTFNEAELNGPAMFNMIMMMDFVDESVGYAAGMPHLLVRTQDGGATWNKISAPGNLLTFFNAVKFLDQDTGFLASGLPEDEKDALSIEDPQQRVEYLLHMARLAKDPVYRMEYREQNASASKGTAGMAWRTDDGGATWTLMLSQPNYSFLNIEMIDSDNGFIIGEPHSGATPLALWRTTDGENWEDVSDTLPQDMGNVQKWAAAALSFQPEIGDVGFVGGAGQSFISFLPVLLYTDDGGDTWNYDETIEELGNPIFQLKWANPKIAYSVGIDLSVFRYTQTNVRPFANAGEDQEGAVGDTMTLDGSASMDYDDDPLTYVWTLFDGPNVDIADTAVDLTSFVPIEAGEYTFELTVSDGQEDDGDTVSYKIAANTDDDDADDDTDGDDDDTDSGDDDAGDINPPADDDDDNDDEGGCGC